MLPEEQPVIEPDPELRPAEPALDPLPEADESNPDAAPRRIVSWLLVGGIVILGLLAAAFVGGRWMNRPENQGNFEGKGPGGAMLVQSQGAAGGDRKTVQILPPKELPQYQPTVNGVFVERQDNSLFLGTGNVTIGVSSETGVKSSYTGPKVEVVITEQTKVYRDASQPDFGNAETTTYQQVAEPSTIEELASSASVSVWGRKVGDRVIADVVFFMSPVMMKKPGGPGGK